MIWPGDVLKILIKVFNVPTNLSSETSQFEKCPQGVVQRRSTYTQNVFQLMNILSTVISMVIY